jgi:hypothetical protein
MQRTAEAVQLYCMPRADGTAAAGKGPSPGAYLKPCFHGTATFESGMEPELGTQEAVLGPLYFVVLPYVNW